MTWPTFPRPDDGERPLVVAAIGPAPAAGAAWSEWFATVDLEDLPYHQARLLPQVFANLHAQGDADRLPARLRGKYRWLWASNQLRIDAVAPALAALQDADVAVMALKGAAMLASGTLAWGAREMGDVDVAVAPEDLGRAARALEAAGWRGRNEVGGEYLVRRLRDRRHSWNFDRGEWQQVDLHWHVLASRPDPAVHHDFWSHARAATLGSVQVLVPDDIGLFLNIVEHASRDEPAGRLVWIVDAARALARVDGDELVERVRALGVSTVVAAGCLALADALGPVGDLDLADLAARMRARPRPRVESLVEWTVEPRLGPWTMQGAGEQLRTYLMHSPGATKFDGLRAFARRRVEPSLWRNRWVGTTVQLAGHMRVPQPLARRLGPLARPPFPLWMAPGEWALMNSGEAIDRVAGPGWSWPYDDGVWAEGREARLVIHTDVPVGSGLVLEFAGGDQVSNSPTRLVRVDVNEQPVADWNVHDAFAHGPVTVDVPARVADLARPLEVTFRPREPFPTAARRGEPGDLRPFLFLRGFRIRETSAPTAGCGPQAGGGIS